ncbi:serine/threonine-protein kinase Nek11-like [Puntigrus tetrazona]|uniref:serine/threonine-protein kinase Nek11-like n=1 Tax=Puntigrus tetrazona TaxID=1606681 RepID=UPI001C894A57|nr:serine/threonine-protein kinase Nek11-like [Puntigrus tetrazona]
MRETVCQKLGEEVFLKVYDCLKQARQKQESEENIRQALIQLVERPDDCFEVDQLLYYEELLSAAQENTRPAEDVVINGAVKLKVIRLLRVWMGNVRRRTQRKEGVINQERFSLEVLQTL